jgi:hypothetical protein
MKGLCIQSQSAAGQKEHAAANAAAPKEEYA